MKTCLLQPCSQDNRPRQSLSPDSSQSLKRFPGHRVPRKKQAEPLMHSDEQVCLAGISVTGGCFRAGGAKPLCLGLISGAHAAPPRGSQTWGWGWGFWQVRYSEELFKAAGSSPLLFTALPGGSCHRHAPTGTAGTQQPSTPTQRCGGGSSCTPTARQGVLRLVGQGS